MQYSVCCSSFTMESISKVCFAVLPLLLLLFTDRGFCQERIHCQWGPFGDWSECDGCTKLQTRSRPMAVYAQFGGNRCDGSRTETRSCETTKGCPLEDGCGDWFRCGSGKCISQSLLCNGDPDCEGDGLDERVCGIKKYIVCRETVLPPNTDLLGLGFDAVTEKWTAGVINTYSFGGQCQSKYSGVHNFFYRLPLSTVKYNFLVTAQTDFSDDIYKSKWHYAKDVVNRETVKGTTTGFKNYDFHETQDETESKRLLVLKNEIEVAQFQSNSPQYLPLSEEFWKALAKLPSVYNYAAYREVLKTYGTHYLYEGSLGGSLTAIVSVDVKSTSRTVSESETYRECEKKKRWILFFPIEVEHCKSGDRTFDDSSSVNRMNNLDKMDVEGGGVEHKAALMRLGLDDQSGSQEKYSNWADSIRSFPKVIKKTLRPISELVKEVQCAGVKKLYLRRAIEQYLSESNSCHCRPCHNNGLAVMDGETCKCICKPGTKGVACEQGTELEGQQGVIHGRWTCWSAWSSCSGGRRSRSRSCSNPSPRNGGQHCIGETTETSDCETEDLQHLRTMEPQCFDHTLQASERCGVPPALVNGYILDPKDVYLVGSKVEYTCTTGLYLIGQGISECAADQTWQPSPGVCTMSRCALESLSKDVIASPSQNNYYIGDSVTLSCPEGKRFVGEATISCDSSGNFSPDPANMQCIPVDAPQEPVFPTVQCKPWEKSARGRCVCKMPFECSSSLELCAASPVGVRLVLLNVCKMHTFHCMGKNFTITENSACEWPVRSTTGCNNCHMWETCDDQTHECRCRDSADCTTPGLNVCVRVGEDASAAAQTMSECEAGLQRCKGAKVSVVSILPCDA